MMLTLLRTTSCLFFLLLLGSSLISGQGFRSGSEEGSEDGEDFENEELEQERNSVPGHRTTTTASTEFVPLEV